jgi:hypothetical protein
MASDIKRKPKISNAPSGVRSADFYHLEDLHFDPSNPRFGNVEVGSAEDKILDRIVELGVTDVLSSLSVNGYMETEPLVGQKQANGTIKILEGNRRLAALLILSGDPRAKKYQKLRAANPMADDALIDPVPVVVYDADTAPTKLLPYLGVRHIVGSKPWDSYAKAAWVANVLETHSELTLEEIERMTGDRRGTIARLLEGYYLVRQLTDTKLFDTEDTIHKGRGSAVGFPFSWVYNVLGYSAVKKWVGMDVAEGQPEPNPIPKKKVAQAAELLVFMFGKDSQEKQPVIRESRELGKLASCLEDDTKIAKLRIGVQASVAAWKGLDAKDRALQSLVKADKELDEATSAVAELGAEGAGAVVPTAKQVRMKAKAIYDMAVKISDGDDD